MRPIKFRGKRKDKNEWVYGSLVKAPKTSIYYIYNGAAAQYTGELAKYEVIPETIGQFTGLLDKGGKEIYEGDIVKHRKTINIGSGTREASGVVNISPCQGVTIGSFPASFDLEIIGNQFENPELLK